MGEALSEDRVVIDDGDADHVFGAQRVTRVPWPGTDSIRAVPAISPRRASIGLAQSEASAGCGDVEAAAVVGDHDFDAVADGSGRNRGVVCACVLADVGQGLMCRLAERLSDQATDRLAEIRHERDRKARRGSIADQVRECLLEAQQLDVGFTTEQLFQALGLEVDSRQEYVIVDRPAASNRFEDLQGRIVEHPVLTPTFAFGGQTLSLDDRLGASSVKFSGLMSELLGEHPRGQRTRDVAEGFGTNAARDSVRPARLMAALVMLATSRLSDAAIDEARLGITNATPALIPIA